MFEKIVIIGAPRSGTNMLRNVLTSLPGMATWPCDEINYVWRYGNAKFPTDEFTHDMARKEVRNYIFRQFEWVVQKYRSDTVVEKTCANSLRVNFVNSVLPEAKYIFIRRNGIDAAASATKRWKATLDIPYLARKVRFVPIKDLPIYGVDYLKNRLHKIIYSNEGRLSVWGPKIEGIHDILRSYTLEEVCALQWKRCVDKAEEGLSKIVKTKRVEVAYEQFVANPRHELKLILDHFGYKYPDSVIANSVSDVSTNNVGKGKTDFSEEITKKVLFHIKETLNRHGYL